MTNTIFTYNLEEYDNPVSYDLEEVPDELTLHLISVTRFEKVKDKWIVPLY